MKTKGPISTGCCLGLTCLKWRADGELSALDFRLVIDRLARVDRHLAALCPIDRDRSPGGLGRSTGSPVRSPAL